MVDRSEHPEKALFPMLLRPEGSVTLDKVLHLPNAEDPMELRVDGRLTFARPMQP